MVHLSGQAATLFDDCRRDVGVIGADELDRPYSRRERERATFDKRKDWSQASHPRHAVGFALVTEWSVVRPAGCSRIPRHDQRYLVGERQGRVWNRRFPKLTQGGFDDVEAERRTLELIKCVHLGEDRCGHDYARDVPNDEREDGLIRVCDVDEHTGVTYERKPRRPFHRLRPGLVELTHLPQIETEDFRRPAERNAAFVECPADKAHPAVGIEVAGG